MTEKSIYKNKNVKEKIIIEPLFNNNIVETLRLLSFKKIILVDYYFYISVCLLLPKWYIHHFILLYVVALFNSRYT